MNQKLFFTLFVVSFFSCAEMEEKNSVSDDLNLSHNISSETYLVVLGTVQDAGSPHIACTKDCCKELFNEPDVKRKVVSLGIVDSKYQKKFIFEATPDFPAQMKMLRKQCSFEGPETPDGIFLTHAHIGHYSGLMYLGKEAMNSSRVPVYAMPLMKIFIESNGPWSQLVSQENIELHEIKNQKSIKLTPNLEVTPFQVPHRDEFSETVGYEIKGSNKKILFIPDIDKWSKWEINILDALKEVDVAFIDGTFYDGTEINNRDISEIPHPFVSESMMLFEMLTDAEKSKIRFIHFNHTNPLLDHESKALNQLIKKGFKIAVIEDVILL